MSSESWARWYRRKRRKPCFDSLLNRASARNSRLFAAAEPGGLARQIEATGGLVAHGLGVAPLELPGRVGGLRITEGVTAAEALARFDERAEDDRGSAKAFSA
jgi:hypothetical protein